jgi:pimeloyl-ACP methyl ester carboxylesterase
MTLLQRIHYVWVRAGLVVLIASPLVMFLAFRAQGLPEHVMITTAAVRVAPEGGYVRFDPATPTRERIILLPGCPVDPVAYAPLAHGLAARGTTSLIVHTPFRCAPLQQHFGQLRALVRQIVLTCEDCRWILAGHSRGARHALELAALSPKSFAALVVMGSTHPRERDFSQLSMPVMKIVGSNDGVAPIEQVNANRHLLPSSTQWVVIDGGNHAQFAYYAFQLFDHRASISREEQHRQVIDALLALTPI